MGLVLKGQCRYPALVETAAGTGRGTHTGFDRRPRLPFLPMTGVPKCSGLVSGSLSSVCARKGGKVTRMGQSFAGNRVKGEQIIVLFERENDFLMRKQFEMNFAERCETGWSAGGGDGSSGGPERGGLSLTSLSAKCRAPFRQREERLSVFSSPSSNTADEIEEELG